MARISTPDNRFLHYTDRSGNCWLWKGGCSKRGRPMMRITSGVGGQEYVHRWSYKRFVGPIPDGLYVLHKCDNPLCVRPSHLFTGTQDDNMKDMVGKGRQNKPKGTKNGRAVLTEEDVRFIRRMYKPRDRVYGEKAFAKRYGVSTMTIHQVTSRKMWTHVE